MEEVIYAEEEEMEKESYEDEEADEGFMEGYAEEGQIEECAECGGAIKEEKKIVKEVDGEEHVFCSETCVKEFKESLGKE